MPIKIQSVTETPPRRTQSSEEFLEFPHPQGKWKLRCDQLTEMAMGLFLWHGNLFYDGRDAGGEHEAFYPYRKWARLFASAEDRPWAGISPVVALFDQQRGFILYDAERKRKNIETKKFCPEYLLGSLSEDYFAAIGSGRLLMLDLEGKAVSEAKLPGSLQNLSKLYWLPQGRHCLAVTAPEGNGQDARIATLAPDRGEVLDEIPIAPSQLVPYDETPYRVLDPDHYCLQLSSSTWAAGCLLHKWSKISFDENKSELYLEILRPTGPVEEELKGWFKRKTGRMFCPVQPKAVLLQLAWD